MTTLRVDILNPKAENLLKSLEDLNLIAIKESSRTGFFDILARLRSKSKKTPSLSEITKEVEAVRIKRHGS